MCKSANSFTELIVVCPECVYMWTFHAHISKVVVSSTNVNTTTENIYTGCTLSLSLSLSWAAPSGGVLIYLLKPS